jgi:hypothetical protein
MTCPSLSIGIAQVTADELAGDRELLADFFFQRVVGIHAVTQAQA